MLSQVRALLVPSRPDEAFQQEMLEDSRVGTLILGGLQVLLALTLPLLALEIGLLLGLATFAAAYVAGFYERLRYIAFVSTALWAILVGTGSPAAAVLVCFFVLIPQMLLEAAVCALVIGLVDRPAWPVLPVAAFAPLLYQYRRQRYESNLRLVQSTQELRLEQQRALSAEHAASLERLAAAMSHELNTPLGAIKSSVQTLRSLVEKYSSATESRRQTLDALQAQLCGTLLDSTDRVQAIVARLQRLTSLDRAAVRPTDINQVLQDVAATVEAGGSEPVVIRLNLHPVPSILCETQAWIIVITRLVEKAASRPAQQVIEVTSTADDAMIYVDITEVGRLVEPGEAARSLDPAFAEKGGRIGASNWSLFQIRGWIRQLGGDLRLSNGEGGATSRLSIPARHVAQATAAESNSPPRPPSSAL